MITKREYAPGEIIIKENDPGETAYVIEEGWVEVTKDVEGQKVYLKNLGNNATVGEMSMIDDKPRSATVTALQKTVVREIHRDEFFDSIKTHPEVALNLLKSLFERLREANMVISQYLLNPVENQNIEKILQQNRPGQADISLTLEGLTPEASACLPESPYAVDFFPFRIGRKSEDPLVNNDLEIQDKPPLQISRHHVSFIKEKDKIGVFDRGSQLGATVDGTRIGGHGDAPGPVFFEGAEGELVLGSANSPYSFKVRVNTR